MWFSIVKAVNLIMVLSDKKITQSGSNLIRLCSEGFYLWFIKSSFVIGRVLGSCPLIWVEKNSNIKIDAILWCLYVNRNKW